MIPAILEDFIPDARTLDEDWRYTNIADIARLNPSKSESTFITYDIAEDTCLPITFHGGFPVGHIRVLSGVTLDLIVDVVTPPPMSEKISLNTLHLILEPGAHVNHIRFTDYDTDHSAFVRITVDVMADAHYHMYMLTTGGQRMRQEWIVNLLGERASTTLACAYKLTGKAHHDLQLRINHLAPHTRSNQYIKGMAADTARGAFQGKISVAKEAQHTEAYQLHKAMVLSERAEINAKPELEIFADQVKCSHGNAVGKLDDDALFLLRSRGLSEAGARTMLLAAFLIDTLDHSPTAHREMLEEKLAVLL